MKALLLALLVFIGTTARASGTASFSTVKEAWMLHHGAAVAQGVYTNLGSLTPTVAPLALTLTGWAGAQVSVTGTADVLVQYGRSLTTFGTGSSSFVIKAGDNTPVPALAPYVRFSIYSSSGYAYINYAMLPYHLDGARPTYCASQALTPPAASATDIFTLQGSATRTVVLKKLVISGTATASGSYYLALVKRSAAGTGAVGATPTAVPLDSADAAATAVYRYYAANPTPGSAVGTLMEFLQPLAVAAGGATTANPNFVDLLGAIGLKPIMLKGTAEILAINGRGVSPPTGGQLSCAVCWEEF